MTSDQFKLYPRCTGRNSPPAKVASEAWLVICRRGGKSFILALVAVFLACFHSYRQFLAPGEKGTILIIATDRKQGRVIFRYIRGLLTQVPMLQKMIERETADTFELDTGIIIEVGTASFRSTRGYTLVAVLCDEIAF
jgi:phage terminase large subunit-like protein